ncbi:2-oxo-4-hydroxy-4-carboxy-5-ureidoimidazoline decarboxylase [Paenibacillus sp. FSL K6-0108]|uniref:2-oxo-4-hydroxy-4-carboxy-5-ureidoimidazoline decarboxylase n=1 Tax=Paenibacillus sp. FSL K6-0108 TaxID=2921417 RepID=UPI003252AE0C
MGDLIRLVNNWSITQFVHTFGGLFEESPWVAERSWSSRPFDSFGQMMKVMNNIVQTSEEKAKLQLLCNHPDLGARISMSSNSVQEQADAGLNSLSEEQYNELSQLNKEYTGRFGFPFILAVKGHTAESILESMRKRNRRGREEEFQTALKEVFKIASIRLEQWLVQMGHSVPPVGGRITTHVLDTSKGIPAAGVRVELYVLNRDGEKESAMKIAESVTNADGRLDAPLLEGEKLVKAVYELQFNVEEYYMQQSTEEFGQALWTMVPIRFVVTDAMSHYHIPLLIAPGAYSTYRGS